MGMGWLMVGMIGGWWMVWYGWAIVAVAPTIWVYLRGWRCLASGFAREHGVEVERRAVEQLRVALPAGEFGMRDNIPMRRFGMCVGNVDLLVVMVESQAGFAVEIKSFAGIVHHWYGWRRLGKVYPLWSPQKQVRGQCRYLGGDWHFPVLWLPESKLDSWFIRDGILVVNGDADLLVQGLRAFNELVRLPIRVSFPYAPGAAYTGFLKGKGFKYDGDGYCWYGRWSRAEVGSLVTVLRDVGGRVSWVGR